MARASARLKSKTDDPKAVRSQHRCYKGLPSFFEDHRYRNIPVANHFVRDDQLLDLLVAGHVVHQVEHQLLEDHAQATRANLALQRITSNRPRSLVGPRNLHALVLEELSVLFEDGVARTRQDVDQGSLVQFVQDTQHWQAANELGDETVLQQVLWLRLTQELRVALCTNRRHFGSVQISVRDRLETERLLANAARDDLLQPNECATADEENVCRIDDRELLVRMLASTLRRNVRDRAFEELQQGLLHAFARNIAGDRGVLVLPPDLVNLIDVDD